MEEILEYLRNELQKGKSLKSISEKFQISELEVLGYVYQLQEEGINIDYYESEGMGYLVRNNHPDMSREETYIFKEDVNEKTKVAFLSDIRMGSQYEQIKILENMYQRFQSMGITKVFILGNLVEGKYTGKTNREYGKSLISNDASSQANHFIDYFPRLPGITTYFITGKLDHSFYKELNIGEYIARKRDDLVYLGPKSCNICFNNVSLHLEQLKQGDAYTIAYPPQKYSRSMMDKESYDAVILSGGLNFQYFPEIRNTSIFSVPSVVDRTPKMISENKSNTIGTFVLEIEYTKSGKLKKLTPIISTYLPLKETYNPHDKIKNIEANTILNSADFLAIDKLYYIMRKEEAFDSLKERLGANDNELYGIIKILKQLGKDINVVNVNGELVVRKESTKRNKEQIKPRMEELHKKTFGIVSDTHYGSIYSQPSMVNTFVHECYNRGITDIFHVGDICDGDYSRIRPIHNSEVFLYGATGQLEYVVKTLPKYQGIKWYGICGSHDQTHFFNYGMDFGKELEKRRDDFTYLGQDRAYFHYDNCTIELFHPGGGTSRILSTKPQNLQDQLPSDRRIDLSLWGHYHKNYYMCYNNRHTILVPCNVAQSSFMMKNGLPNLMGDYIVTIYYDDNGYIHYIIPEAMVFTEEDVRNRDYENPRIIRNKILTRRK